MAESCVSYSPISFVNSKWVWAWLPVRYKATSTKWPVNSFDPLGTITSITDDNGFAKITFSGDTYEALEYVKINNTDFEEYEGIWQVKQVNTDSTITISAPHVGDDTSGDIQRYYQNYVVRAKVFVGIPDGHTKNTERPITEKGVIALRPDTSNEVQFDISSFVRADLSPIQNNLCTVLGGLGMGNDTDLWTGFYISLAESYDRPVNGELTTFTSDYITNFDTDGITPNYHYAINGTKNFQYSQGRSAGEYVLADVVGNAKIKFLTHFDEPTYFVGHEHDISIASNYGTLPADSELRYRLEQRDENGSLLFTNNGQVPTQGEGLYRLSLENFSLNALSKTVDVKFLLYNTVSTNETDLTDFKRVNVERSYPNRGIYLRWLNTLGGWDGWYLSGLMDYQLETSGSQVIERDIFSNFDSTFVNGNAQRDYISTKAVEKRTVRSQFLSLNEIVALNGILYSNKVVQVFEDTDNECGQYKYRTVLIDRGSFTYRQGRNRLYEMTFQFEYSDYIQIQGQ